MTGLIERLLKRVFSKGSALTRESRDWDSLSRTIGYQFKNSEFLKLALTHRSALGESKSHFESNERLEFLGDAVLGMVITEKLYLSYPKRSEGRLTRAKSVLVSRETLAKHARRMDLGRYLFLGAGEERSGGRNRHSILSNAMEAVIGAVYLDGGLEAVRILICKHLLEEMDTAASDRFHKNYKSWLLEFAQAQGNRGPEYHVVEESGPDHRKFFKVEVSLNGKTWGLGEGRSKKLAEQAAAQAAVEAMGLSQ